VLLDDIVGVASGVFTTIFAVFTEFANALVEALSIVNTFASRGELLVQKEFVMKVKLFEVVMMFATIVFETALNIRKLYVYGGVPPVSYVASVVDWPWSIMVLVNVGVVGFVNIELTTIFEVFAELANPFVVALSRTDTLAFNGEFEAQKELLRKEKELLVVIMFATIVFDIALNTRKL